MILPLLLQAVVPAPGSPQLPPQPPATLVVEPVAMAIAAFDADGDARVSRAELIEGVRRSFAAIDTAQAGAIGYIAFADWAERFLGDRNALPSPFETDADADNRITLAELQAKMAEVFARLDRDRDGTVTRAECLTIRATPPRRDEGKKRK
jgi:Ca2+-binding EF-hand superfamily protein